MPANAKEIVVTEGEFDAMAVYQVQTAPKEETGPVNSYSNLHLCKHKMERS